MRLSILILLAASLANAGAQAEPLRVMTFNIRYGTANDGDDSWPNRRQLVFQTIRDFQPDLLGVQEALHFQVEELVATLDGYEWIGVGRDDGKQAGEYSAILYRADRYELVDSGAFWLSDTPEIVGSKSWGNEVIRCCTWGRFRDKRQSKEASGDTASSETFLVFNTHWDHQSQPSREKSAELIVQRIAQTARENEPALLTGDFNAGEDNPAFIGLLGGKIGLFDTFRRLRQDASEVGTFNGFRGRSNGPKIDAILATPHWQVQSAEIDRTNDDGRYPSDHCPVTAVIQRK